MKRIFILTVLMAVLGLTSCEKEPSKAIIGSWEATTVEMTMEGIKMEMDITEFGTAMEITFNDNGTGTIIETLEGDSVNMDFTYSMEGNTLTIEAEGEVAEIPVTIEKKNMTMTISGEMMEEPGMNITIHFVKK
jgi:hypothetical protein